MPTFDAVTVLAVLAVGTISVVAVMLLLIFTYSRRQESTDWELGISYLVKEKGATGALALFRKLNGERNSHGIIITRTFPEKIQKDESLINTSIWWLSREESPHSISPSSLPKIAHVIRDFIKEHESAVVFFDGVEYLMMHNGFETTLRFLQAVNDLIILNRATLIIPVDPSSFSVKQLSLLEKEMEIHRLSMNILRLFGE